MFRSFSLSRISLKFNYALSSFYKRYENFFLLTRLDKPIGILLLLWPTLWGIWVASEGHPDPVYTLVFIAGVILTRSAGCAINDYADRKYDGRVNRTKTRVLASGKMKPATAVLIFVVLSLIAFALVVLFLPRLCWYLAIAGAALIFVYPFMKRFTHLPQIVLGMAFAMSVPMAYAAHTGGIPQIAWIMYTGVVLWTTAYDTMYALVDKKDDVTIGIKSTAILFGKHYLLILAVIQVLVLLSLLFVGSNAKLNWPFHAGLAVASVLAAYQLFLVYDRVPERCFRAFLNNNWFGLVIFLGILYHYLLQNMKDSLWLYIISAYILSIYMVYLVAVWKRIKRSQWVLAATLFGPFALLFSLFERRR
ncbi:4-hydroxybenzoate polyprenyltransferase [hydrothermal vent metagenome]|uniref:4-hydroxybenzoate polyprenyltransferase n=1 Tax=hydrothermal vent metagenome TaxID=652676 RepID=A0A3B0YPG7_9ZZZZ